MCNNRDDNVSILYKLLEDWHELDFEMIAVGYNIRDQIREDRIKFYCDELSIHRKDIHIVPPCDYLKLLLREL